MNNASEWNTKFELDYQRQKNPSYYLEKKIKPKHSFFDVDSRVKSHFGDRKLNLVIDVGGGIHGGALFFFKKGHQRVLFDKLGDEGKKLHLIPESMKVIDGDFEDLPFEDSSVDVLFAWEVLDHALNMKHFQKGQSELVRVLSKDGLLFFEQPIRKTKKPCHLSVDLKTIEEGFSSLTPIRRNLEFVGPERDRIWYVLTK